MLDKGLLGFTDLLNEPNVLELLFSCSDLGGKDG